MQLPQNNAYAEVEPTYRKRAEAHGAIPERSGFSLASEDEIAKRLDADRRFNMYLTRFVRNITSEGDFEACIALFDSQGYLLKLFGPEEIQATLAQDGIIPRSIFRLEELGPTRSRSACPKNGLCTALERRTSTWSCTNTPSIFRRFPSTSSPRLF